MNGTSTSLCLTYNNGKALNIPISHDYYVNYVRDLLTDTRGRLDRMHKLSEEINLLAKQITPMSGHSAFTSSPVTETNGGHLTSSPVTKAIGELKRDGDNSTEGSLSTLNNKVYLPYARVKRKLLTPVSCPKTIGMISEEEEHFQSHNSPELKKDQKTDSTKNKLRSATTLSMKPSSPGNENKEPDNPLLNRSDKLRNKTAVKLKLKVVLPRCDNEGSVRLTRQESHSGRSQTTKDIVVKSEKLKDPPRESLRIPRVVIQSFSNEKYFDEIRLPKIMEKFHRPLQLTARTFRLPAFKRE